jgi:hypothetical protein
VTEEIERFYQLGRRAQSARNEVGLPQDALNVSISCQKQINHLKERIVADGEKPPKLIVCKFPGPNIENPGDPFVTLFASLF